jgi:hypothetical protein
MLLAGNPEKIRRSYVDTPVANDVCGTGVGMDADRFDRLTKTLGAPASRRLALRGLVAALAAMFSQFTAIFAPAIAGDADESGMAISDASGGDQNSSTVVDPATSRNDRDRDHHRDRDRDRKNCQPDSQSERCEGRCGQVVDDGCGDTFDCTCEDGTVCAPGNGVCCQPELLCSGKRVCCASGEVCGPGDACCPSERSCFPSNVCCVAGEECTRGGGTCCPLAQVCRVGGVAAACCPSGPCINGVC